MLLDSLNNNLLIFSSIIGRQSSYKTHSSQRYGKKNPTGEPWKTCTFPHTTWRKYVESFQGGKALPHPP